MTLAAAVEDLSGLDGLIERLEQGDIEFPTPGALAQYLDSRVIQTPALDVLDAALIDAYEGRHRRLIFTMPPQEGKSQRVSRTFPVWLLRHNPDLRIAIVSYMDLLARRWGRVTRNDIQTHPELGMVVRQDTGAANEWQLEDHDGGVITAGIEGGITGRPVDVLIIDDPLKGMAEADSEIMRENVNEVWRSTLSTRFSEDAVVIVVMTRWHEADLAGYLAEYDPGAWRVINVPAQCEDPETDPLGRAEVGEFMISARSRSRAGWEQRKKDAGPRTWTALFQGHPAPAEGGIFKRAWWRFAPFDRAPLLSDGTRRAATMDFLMISVDATFKDTKGSDFVSMQVWGKAGPRACLLEQVLDRMNFPDTIANLRELCKRWPDAHLILIEDKANGPAIISTLSLEIPGIVPFTPLESKVARANAVAHFPEAGNVEINGKPGDAWVERFITECASFPNGLHDDQVDAMTQALHRLLIGDSLTNFMDQLTAERRGRAVPQHA